ncbi:MAG: nucleotide disphospho-sugar-binding domain-containing protein [Acidimicrobiales bacterium]
MPQGADQFLNARAVASASAGLSLEPAEVTPAAAHGAVQGLLTDASLRDAAGRVASFIAAMPSPDDVAVVLEGLAS